MSQEKKKLPFVITDEMLHAGLKAVYPHTYANGLRNPHVGPKSLKMIENEIALAHKLVTETLGACNPLQEAADTIEALNDVISQQSKLIERLQNESMAKDADRYRRNSSRPDCL